MSTSVRIAKAGIRFYQRRLSPLKGFRCAHAALHGGASCSGAILSLIEVHGLAGSWPLVLARFAACKVAHEALLQDGFRARGVCCCGGIPIPFRCGGV